MTSSKKDLRKPESVCKTGQTPLALLCDSHSDLDLYPIDPKIEREHQLCMTNVCMKLDQSKLYLLIKQGCIQWRDRQVQSNIYPLLPRGTMLHPGGSVVSGSDSEPGGCEFDPWLR